MSGLDRPALVERVSIAVGALALVALLWPASPQVTPRAVRTPDAPALPAGADAAAIDSTREQIVASNLFSASRRAPRERFVAPGTISSSMPESMPAPDAASGGAPGANVEAGPQLFGILSIDGSPRALLQIAADSAPRLLEEGARIGSWRVRRIAADRVELSSSSGTRVVRLSRRTPPDSAEMLP